MKKRVFVRLLVLLVILLLMVACQPQEVVREVEVPVEVTRVVTETVTEGGEEVEVTRVVTESEVQVVTATPEPESEADMFFEDYGVNPFVETAADNLSTFAIDVDTGSYTMMRNFLAQGQLPPADSVRVEEYVNYFDQAYQPPAEGAFAIHLEGAPAPYGEDERDYLVRIGIKGYEVPEDQRPPALLIFVIDVSGSMEQDNRLGLVKRSLLTLVEALRPDDRIGIVVYGSQAREVLPPTSASSGANRAAILDAIYSLDTEGSTNAEAGLQLAYQMASEYIQPGQINRLILCSDGVANVGNTTAEAILQHAAEGISLSTFGFGMGNYNDTLMEQLADNGDGTYAYVDTAEEAERLFIDNLTDTLLTIAKDARIQVEFNTSVVEQYRLLGYENRAVADEAFRDDTVDAGEIGAGHSVTALYEVRLAEEASEAQPALTVHVRYSHPETAEIQEVAQSIGRRDFATTFAETSPYFQLDAVVAEYAEILRHSYWAQGNDLMSLLRDIFRIADTLPEDADVQEFARLATEAAALSQ
jgi:Ca-activated chloride channel homolog